MEPPGDGTPGGGGRRVVVLNPNSGTGDHAPQVRLLAEEYGFDVHETSAGGEAITAAERHASDASLVAACGGDGTVNEVVRGLRRANALQETTLGVVPAGTGNNFAGNVGVTGVRQAFEVMAEGERRRIDLGVVREAGDDADGNEEADGGGDTDGGDDADGGGDINGSGDAGGGEDTDAAGEGRPFVNSCVCGITAEASSSTEPDQKGRLGTLAYVLNTFRELGEFDPITLSVRTNGDVAESWAGEAVAVLVGNGRRFPEEGTTQANMEDSRLDVTIIESEPALELVGDEAVRRFLAAEADHITRHLTPSLEIQVLDGEDPAFSLDGEILTAGDVHLTTETRTLELCVGEGYEPDPDS